MGDGVQRFVARQALAQGVFAVLGETFHVGAAGSRAAGNISAALNQWVSVLSLRTETDCVSAFVLTKSVLSTRIGLTRIFETIISFTFDRINGEANCFVVVHVA